MQCNNKDWGLWSEKIPKLASKRLIIIWMEEKLIKLGKEWSLYIWICTASTSLVRSEILKSWVHWHCSSKYIKCFFHGPFVCIYIHHLLLNIKSLLCCFPCCWGPNSWNAPPIFDHNTPIKAEVDTSQLLSIDVCAQLIWSKRVHVTQLTSHSTLLYS